MKVFCKVARNPGSVLSLLPDFMQLGVLCLVSVALFVSGAALAQTVVVPGVGVGAIPDRGTPGCGSQGPDLEITFAAPELTNIRDIEVGIDMEHSWLGDISTTLVAPDNDQHILFASTGSTTATGCGSADDLNGLYVFSDILPVVGDWWAQGNPYPVGNYRSTTPGDVAGGGAEANITASFDSSYPAGTWKLLVSDGGGGDTGTVNAATLRITHNLSSLTTTFAAGNGASGNAFNVTAKEAEITVRSLDIHLSGNTIVKVFTKPGSYVGNLNSPGLWTEIASEALNGSTGTPTPIEINDVNIAAGQTAGFVVHIQSGGTILYTNGDGSNENYANADLSLFSDIGLQSDAPFTWTGFFQPRVWNGTVYYTVGEQSSSCYVSTTLDGKAFSFCL